MWKIKFKINPRRKNPTKKSNFNSKISPYGQNLLDSMFGKWK